VALIPIEVYKVRLSELALPLSCRAMTSRFHETIIFVYVRTRTAIWTRDSLSDLCLEGLF